MELENSFRVQNRPTANHLDTDESNAYSSPYFTMILILSSYINHNSCYNSKSK
jgi:hypothetical protein